MIETTTRTCMRCRIVFPFCRVPHCCSQAVLDVCAGYCCLQVPFCCCSSGSIILLSVASVFWAHHNCSCLHSFLHSLSHPAAAPDLDATVMHRVLYLDATVMLFGVNIYINMPLPKTLLFGLCGQQSRSKVLYNKLVQLVQLVLSVF